MFFSQPLGYIIGYESHVNQWFTWLSWVNRWWLYVSIIRASWGWLWVSHPWPLWTTMISTIGKRSGRGLAMVAHSAAKLGIKDKLWPELTRSRGGIVEALWGHCGGILGSDLREISWRSAARTPTGAWDSFRGYADRSKLSSNCWFFRFYQHVWVVVFRQYVFSNP